MSSPSTPPAYTVIGTARSRAMRVLWALEELGLAYTHIPARPRSEELRQYTTTGKVPVLLVDDEVLTDSSAIVQYLADRHDGLTYAAGTILRARQDALMHRVLDEVDACLWTAARHSYVLPQAQRVPAIQDSLRWELARNLTGISAQLGEGPYLMGQRFTVADIILGHCLNWAVFQDIPLPDQRLQDYAARVQARPALLRALAT